MRIFIFMLILSGLPQAVYATTQNTSDSTFEIVQGVGYVEPVGDVLRLNFKQPGLIKKCWVRVGQFVQQGDLLVQQDSTDQQARLMVEEAAANLARAELKQTLAGVNPARITAQKALTKAKQASSDYAHLQAQRMVQLVQKNSVSAMQKDLALSDAVKNAADVQASEAEVQYLQQSVRTVDKNVAQAHVSLAEAKMNLQKAYLSDTELRAPIDGVVLEIIRREGDSTDSKEPVLLFANIKQLQVRAELDENYALMLKPGQKATVSGRGLIKTTLEGQVNLVKPIMGKKTVFSKSATERKDIDIRQVLITLPEAVDLPIGLEVDVAIRVSNPS